MAYLVRSSPCPIAMLLAAALAACGGVSRDDPGARGDSTGVGVGPGSGGSGGEPAAGGAGTGGGGARPIDDLGCGRADANWESAFVPTQAGDRAPIWGPGPDDVWAVGRGEAIGYRFDGDAWAPAELGDDLEGAAPTSIGGTSGDDVFLSSSSGLVLRRTAGAWVVDGDTLPDAVLWGFAPGQLLAVGPTGAGRRTAAGWAAEPTPAAAVLRAVHGSGAADAFAVGDGGIALHWDGVAWAVVPNGTSADLAAVWSVGPGRAVAVGSGGTILSLTPDGAEPWASPLPEPWSEHPIRSVWADADGVLFVATVQTLHTYDGAAWASQPLDFFDAASSVWGTSRFDVFIGGAQFVVLHCRTEPRGL